MKTIIIALVLVASNAQAAEIFTSTTMFNEYRQSGGHVPTVNLYTETKASDSVSIFGFASANPYFGEVYAGSMIKTVSWLDLGLGGGISGGELVLAPYVQIAKGNLYWLSLGEFTKNSQFYMSTLTVKVSDSVKFGGFLKRYSGIGPQVSYKIPELPVTVMAAPLYDLENKSYTGFTSVSLAVTGN